MAKVEIVPYGKWARNLLLADGRVELVVTLDVGPRVIALRPPGGDNVFKNFEDQIGGSGEPTWKSRGGHRLWLAPESMPFTYHPDNGPVEHAALGDGAVRVTAPPEATTGFRKALDVSVDGRGGVRVVHRITNVTDVPRAAAPWALTVMAPGGVEVIPLPPMRPHPGDAPGDFSPNRTVVLWPFTDLSDPRWHLGSRFIALRQDASRGPTKMGLAHAEGWAAYHVGTTLFVKRFGHDPAAAYPDRGCNFETFANEDMLEVETLGPLATLAPGESAEHVEEWRLVTGVPAPAWGDEGDLARLAALAEAAR